MTDGVVAQRAGGSRPAGWAVAARLARREIRRRPGRTALVAVLVALPVAGMVVAAALTRFAAVTAEEQWTRQYGRADAVILAGSGTPLPTAARLVQARSEFGVRLMTADGHRAIVEVQARPTTDPVTEGMATITAGRLPTAPGEVLLSPEVATALGADLGATFDLTRPSPGRLTVTGIGRDAGSPRTPLVLVPPDGPLTWTWDATTYLVDWADPSGPDATAWLRTSGASARPGRGVGKPPPYLPAASPDTRLTGIVGAGTAVLAAAATVMVAAFAAGGRRQLATVGLLLANGAPPRAIRRMLALQGFGTGLVGAAGGVALAVTVILARPPFLVIDQVETADELARLSLSALRPPDVAAVVALAIVTATVAALVPSRRLSRVPTLAALAGRRPEGRVSMVVTGLGAVALPTGVVAVAVAAADPRLSLRARAVQPPIAVAGVVLVALGACALMPAWVALLGPVGARLGGRWRLACRGLVRSRTHSAAVVAAVLATSGLTVAVATGLTAYDADAPGRTQMRAFSTADRVGLSAMEGPRYVDLPPGVLARAEAITGARVHRLTFLRPPRDSELAVFVRPCQPEPCTPGIVSRDRVVVADDEARAAYRLGGEPARRLDEVGAAFTADLDGTAMIGLTGGSPEKIPAAAIGDPAFTADSLLVTPARAAALAGWSRDPGSYVLPLDAPLSGAQQRELRALADDAGWDLAAALPADADVQVSAEVGTGPSLWQEPVPRTGVLVGAALLLTLAVVAAGLALAAAETRAERNLLVVAGAPPATLRALSGRRAFLLTLLGTTAAVPVGWVPMTMAITAGNGRSISSFPTAVVVLLVVALPVAAALTTTAGSALALRWRPVRSSSLAAD